MKIKNNEMFRTLLLVVAVCFHSVTAVTDEDMKAQFLRYVMKCSKSHPVEVSEMMKLNKLIPPTRTDVKCLLACVYKMEGVMTKDGKYDLKHGYALAEIIREGNDKRYENGIKIADMCNEVNNMEVSDGEKGCERAGAIFKIMVENAPKMGFKL